MGIVLVLKSQTRPPLLHTLLTSVPYNLRGILIALGAVTIHPRV